MLPILILLIFAAVACLVILLLTSLCLCWFDPSRTLRLVFVLSLLAGCALAVWCAFFFEYQTSATVRIVGIPFPAAIFKLENGQWVDYVGGFGLYVDLAVIPSLVTSPIAIALVIRAFRRQRHAHQRGFSVVTSVQ